MQIGRCDDSDRSSVVVLWEAAGLLHPNNDPYADIDGKFADSLTTADGTSVAPPG